MTLERNINSRGGAELGHADRVASFARTGLCRSMTALCLGLVVFFAVVDTPANAQVIYGTVPGAKVKITSLRTNEVRTASTSAAGTYSFPNLARGLYRPARNVVGRHPSLRHRRCLS